MKTMRYLLLLGVILSLQAYSQESADTLPNGYKRNVIKWNMTPFLLWSSSNINVSYERVLKPHRSFSVNAGYFILPTIWRYDSLRVESARKKSGFSVAGDYRFYFKKKNTGFAPDGLYWGIYGSFHHFGFLNTFSVQTASGSTGSLSFDGNLNILSLGLQLGYQFVIKERLSIDLIFMGPSASVYSVMLGLKGDIDINEEDEYLMAIRDLLFSNFPFLDELIADHEFNAGGVSRNLGPGLRYMIQIGYRF